MLQIRPHKYRPFYTPGEYPDDDVPYELHFHLLHVINLFGRLRTPAFLQFSESLSRAHQVGQSQKLVR